ncbi:MAG: hypothetical protein K0R61_1181 [Microvirga sp.]|jgi:hypothetical protein|nr:hypothetical protein [Microvirga sp.]MDF2970731.1 hypothetical protein [Microvirga sp.]
MREHLVAMYEALFAQAGEQAEYTPPDGWAETITVLVDNPDYEADLGGQVVARQGLHVKVRKTELPAPVKGAELLYNDMTYSVRDPRDADTRGILWLLPLSRIA